MLRLGPRLAQRDTHESLGASLSQNKIQARHVYNDVRKMNELWEYFLDDLMGRNEKKYQFKFNLRYDTVFTVLQLEPSRPNR